MFALKFFLCHSDLDLRGFRARADAHAPLAPDYTICDFQSGTKSVSSLHNNRMKFHARTIISFGLKTGMTSTGTKCRLGLM